MKAHVSIGKAPSALEVQAAATTLASLLLAQKFVDIQIGSVRFHAVFEPLGSPSEIVVTNPYLVGGFERAHATFLRILEALPSRRCDAALEVIVVMQRHSAAERRAGRKLRAQGYVERDGRCQAA